MTESHDGEFPSGHFHSPSPAPEDLATVQWTDSLKPLRGIDWNLQAQRVFFEQVARFSDELKDVPTDPGSEAGLYWMNPMLPPADILVYYAMIRTHRPQTIVEVGAGYSTVVALRAASQNGGARVVCVEPYPKRTLLSQKDQLHQLLKIPVQQADPHLFEGLESGDILFIDSSHVSKTGSDVNHLLFNVLPMLKPGVLVHFHDIFLPHEYPEFWLKTNRRFWNEQYALLAFLQFNSAFEILFGNAMVTQRHEAEFLRAAGSLYDKRPEVWRRDPALSEPVLKAGSFWLRVRE